MKKNYKSENVFSLTELIVVCNVNQYVSAYKVVWTNFYNWNNFLNTFLKVQLKAIKKYQLFESCSRNDGTIECQSSGLADCVMYSDDLLKPNMTIQALQIALWLKPKSYTRNAQA